MALVAFALAKALKTVFKKRAWIAYTLAGIAAELVMIVGYFFFEAVFMSYGMGAIVSVLPNVSQAAVGIAIGVSLMTIIDRTHLIEKIMGK
jgi:tetrahydromethanopterin S-methyltransferase subunit D